MAFAHKQHRRKQTWVIVVRGAVQVVVLDLAVMLKSYRSLHSLLRNACREDTCQVLNTISTTSFNNTVPPEHDSFRSS